MITGAIILAISIGVGFIGSLLFDSFRVVDGFRESKKKKNIREIDVIYDDISAGN